MKKLIVLLLVAGIFIFYSCGSAEDKGKNKNDSKEEVAQNYQSSTGNLIVELKDGWTKGQTGIEGPEGHKLYAYNFESSGDIYEDIDDDYSEKLDEVKEVNVDGLPALTIKRKFMQNEVVMQRVWLIYNGIDVILFAVQAPEAKFNDEIALAVIPNVKITERQENVELPSKAKEKYVKPANFPEDIANKLTDLYAENVILTDDIINKVQTALQAIQNYDNEGFDFENADEAANQLVDSIAKANGVDGWYQIEKTVSVAFTSAGILLPLMAHLDSIDENSVDYAASIDIVKSSISNYNISLEDLKYCYENWDKVVGFMESQEK